MTYKELAEEYFNSAAELKEKMSELKSSLTIVPSEQLKEIHLRVASLYHMYLDCMHTGDNLIKRKGVISCEKGNAI
jgi:hypothetical protein